MKIKVRRICGHVEIAKVTRTRQAEKISKARSYLCKACLVAKSETSKADPGEIESAKGD